MAGEDKYRSIGESIYDNVGGTQNVEKLINCMTRVRMTIRDESKVDVAGLKKIPGVLGVVQEDTLQVVLGPGVVSKVAQSMVDEVGVDLGAPFPEGTKTHTAKSGHDYKSAKEEVEAKAEQVHSAHKAALKQTWWRAALKHISSIFIPLIPAFVGAGLISGIAGVLGNLQTVGAIGAEWGTFILTMKVINQGLFAFLNVYIGINAAKEFGATQGLGGIIAGLIYLPGVVAPLALPNVFTGKDLVAGSGGVLGVLFAVWIMSYVERWFHKHIPDSLDIIIVPFLTLLVMGLFTIFLVMPAAGWVSNSLVGAINWVLNVGGAFSGFVLGLVFLPMVMLGLHQILTPIHLEMIKDLGMTPLLPILAMAGAGQVGAAIALWIRCRKNKQLTRMIKGALPVGILGVGEPLIYGVSLPLGRPFITACIGGGVGGAVVGAIGGIGATSIGPSGIALIPLIAGGFGKALGYVIGLLAAYLGGFVATYFFGTPKSAMVATAEDGTILEGAAAGTNAQDTSTPEELESEQEHTMAGLNTQTDTHTTVVTDMVAPVEGNLIQLGEVDDETFSQKLLGDGFAINPEMQTVVAPVDGKIFTISDTKHAFTMISDSGLEVLVHLGIDTVELDGGPFSFSVKVGQHVLAGQQLGLMDLEKIREAGKKDTVITVVTNMDAVSSFGSYTNQHIEVGTKVLSVTGKEH
ncbi:glucose PTS transporter subunit IIA [Bifidobacterium aquikefiri]|uniref:glucose PTS transporter subunit IIA n=1 Tax=Bifidobacterium aquikefiri TaxID=1653207 RepID=UPI0039ECD53B